MTEFEQAEALANKVADKMRDDALIAKLVEGNACEQLAAERLETLARLDREASTHVETVICMRTHFTGEPPYVGWKGLGLALAEALDAAAAAISSLQEENGRLREALKPFSRMCERNVQEHHRDGDGCQIVMSNREMRRARDALKAGEAEV